MSEFDILNVVEIIHVKMRHDIVKAVPFQSVRTLNLRIEHRRIEFLYQKDVFFWWKKVFQKVIENMLSSSKHCAFE